MVRNAALKDAANRAVMKLGYTRGMKEEQLEVVVEFLSGSDVFAVLPTGFGNSLCYACLPFAFELLIPLRNRSYIVLALLLSEHFTNTTNPSIAQLS